MTDLDTRIKNLVDAYTKLWANQEKLLAYFELHQESRRKNEDFNQYVLLDNDQLNMTVALLKEALEKQA